MTTSKLTAPSKQETEEAIEKLLKFLCKIDDTSGDFILDFDGVKVDDKSWCVWNWPQGVGLYGVCKNYRLTKNERARAIVDDWFSARMGEGAPEKNINTMAPLLTMACRYEDTRDCKYVPYLERWAEWAMRDLTRTEEGGFQHVTYGPERRNQMWDDTLMMTVLPLAKIGRVLGRPSYVEEAKYQFLIHTQYLQDKKTGLWFHGWNFEGRHNFGEAFWCRGNCWITIAIPELLETLDLPEDDAFRRHMIQVLNAQIAALAELQDQGTGLWHTLLDEPDSYVETSGSAGAAYGILKAVHCRYVDASFERVALNAIAGLMNQIGDRGQVANVSVGTECAMDRDYYRHVDITEMPYGQSLTVLALTEHLLTFC
ncbi:MAG: glycoside hydrolase family 88 protein [Collinsella sp.]|nr:glycoside hydrolase family 88 protein [Collinsella sp.]